MYLWRKQAHDFPSSNCNLVCSTENRPKSSVIFLFFFLFFSFFSVTKLIERGRSSVVPNLLVDTRTLGLCMVDSSGASAWSDAGKPFQRRRLVLLQKVCSFDGSVRTCPIDSSVVRARSNTNQCTLSKESYPLSKRDFASQTLVYSSGRLEIIRSTLWRNPCTV